MRASDAGCVGQTGAVITQSCPSGEAATLIGRGMPRGISLTKLPSAPYQRIPPVLKDVTKMSPGKKDRGRSASVVNRTVGIGHTATAVAPGRSDGSTSD